MDKGPKKSVVRLIASRVFLIVVLCWMYFLNYIDASVILVIYVPIWIIGALAARINKIVFANIFRISAGIDLIAEYFIHVSNGPAQVWQGHL